MTLKDLFARLDIIAVLGFLIAVETQITNGSMSFAHSLPETWIPAVKEWSGNLASVGGLLVGLIRMSGNAASATAAIAKILIVGIILSLFLFAGTAHAAQRSSTAKSFAGSALPCDPANLLPGCKQASAATSTQPVDLLSKLMDDIAAKAPMVISNVIDAINESDADAATLTNPNDPTSFRDAISHACYPQQIKFLQSLPQIQAIKSPAPYNLIVLFQRKRDLIAQIKAGLPSYLKVGCAALLGDEATIFAQTLGMIGVTVGAGTLTGIFPAAAPVTLALPAIAGL